MDSHDNYDISEEADYTKHTCGPAYEKWHALVSGMETNHWAITKPGDTAVSGMVPCSAKDEQYMVPSSTARDGTSRNDHNKGAILRRRPPD